LFKFERKVGLKPPDQDRSDSAELYVSAPSLHSWTSWKPFVSMLLFASKPLKEEEQDCIKRCDADEANILLKTH
jgi:hypothetical protein